MNVLEKSDLVEHMQKALGTTFNVTIMDSNTVIKMILTAIEKYDRQQGEKKISATSIPLEGSLEV